MAAPFVYRLRSALLCVDRQTRGLMTLDPGTIVVYVSAEDGGMVALRLRRPRREVLAFAVDFEDRAEAVAAAAHEGS
jgi:hypothetical protein